MVKKIIYMIWLLCSALLAGSVEDILNQNGCMECHNVMGKKSAPAFRGIARKSSRFYSSNAKTTIINSIKNGSVGKYRQFAGTQMPPYKNLTEQELDAIAEWILAQGQGATGRGGRGNGGRR